MIELKKDALVFSFPEVHQQAELKIDFQRTLRIPDDDKTYPLPPGLGRFPLRHVDDFADKVPPAWMEHGGVMLPMHQSEAMWLMFDAGYVPRRGPYPVAVKIATGKIDAVTGNDWSDGLHRDPQDYVVPPQQPWLDGYCVEKGVIRQFVAMPLGAGYSAEEQVTGEAKYGGLQIAAYPMKREVFERRFPEQPEMELSPEERLLTCAFGAPPAGCDFLCESDMGLAPGGRMTQDIYDDPFDIEDWDISHTSRCFVHIANSLVWRAITGRDAPTAPPTAEEYTRSGLPWFDYYSDSGSAVEGSSVLGKIKSVVHMGKIKGDVPLPENQSVEPSNVVDLRAGLKNSQVREGRF